MARNVSIIAGIEGHAMDRERSQESDRVKPKPSGGLIASIMFEIESLLVSLRLRKSDQSLAFDNSDSIHEDLKVRPLNIENE
jgi:hypothetical protein